MASANTSKACNNDAVNCHRNFLGFSASPRRFFRVELVAAHVVYLGWSGTRVEAVSIASRALHGRRMSG